MNPRQTAILKAVVKEFIHGREPVSSERLYRRYDFGIKPAAIRLELNALVAAGYLSQPHYAAGRLPTDKGYEFYIRELLAQDLPPIEISRLRNYLRRHRWQELSESISEELKTLAAAYIFPERAVYKSMLGSLIDRLDWPAMELRSLVHDFESLENRVAALEREVSDRQVSIFLGRRSPVTTTERLAVIAGDCEVNRHRVFVCVIGPKEMNYERAVRLIKGLKY